MTLAVSLTGCSSMAVTKSAVAPTMAWSGRLLMRAVPLSRLVPLPKTCRGWTEGYFPQIATAGYGAANKRLRTAFEQVNGQAARLHEGATCVVAAGAQVDNDNFDGPSGQMFVSASASLLSVLVGLTIAPANSAGVAQNYFVACTLALPSAVPLPLASLFREPRAAEAYLTARASDPVPSSCDLETGNRSGFALTRQGLRLEFRSLENSNRPPYDFFTTVAYRAIGPYLSPHGRQVIASVRSPQWVGGRDLNLDGYGNPAN
jgi:hypothetical protein